MPNVNRIYSSSAAVRRTKSEQGPPGCDRPETLDPGTLDPGTLDPGTLDPGTLDVGLRPAKTAHAHVPIVQIDGGVAVAGHEQDLVPPLRPLAQGRGVDDAVLIGGTVVEGARQAPGHGHTAVDGERLE